MHNHGHEVGTRATLGWQLQAALEVEEAKEAEEVEAEVVEVSCEFDVAIAELLCAKMAFLF